MLEFSDISSATKLVPDRVRLTHHSTAREKVFEHLLLGNLGAELLARGIEFEVLRSESDAGVDIVLESGSIVRHI